MVRFSFLITVQEAFAPLAVDASVAEIFAEAVAALRREGRRAPIMDAWIAATAIRHGLPLYSQDAGFQAIPHIQLVLI